MRHPLKSGEIARAAPPDAHDAQLSNGPIGASIRDPSPRSAHSTFNIQQCQLLQSHSTQHTALEFGLSQCAKD